MKRSLISDQISIFVKLVQINMYEYITGKFTSKTPTHIVVEANNIGYFIHISLYTFSRLKDKDNGKVFLYLSIKEDAHSLFGFADEDERFMFKQLLSVSGVGASTARMILSSTQPAELQQAIVTGNAPLLQNIKGIGAKTAQRIIIDLKDKLKKPDAAIHIPVFANNTIKEEALSALLTLGFAKNIAEKALDSLLRKQENWNVENLIKSALSNL